LSKFTVGDYVSFTYNGAKNTGYIKEIEKLAWNNFTYSDIIVDGGKKMSVYDSAITLITPFSKERSILNKINQLYERQVWVQQGNHKGIQMSKFNVGDLVRTSKEYNSQSAYKGIIKQTNLVSDGKRCSKIIYNGDSLAFFDSHLELVEKVDKKKLLIDKINQLYERQVWIKEGKPQALCYAKLPVPDVEKKEQTEAGITLQSTQTVMNSAFDAHYINRQRMQEQVNSVLRWSLDQTGGQLPSLSDLMRGSEGSSR